MTYTIPMGENWEDRIFPVSCAEHMADSDAELRGTIHSYEAHQLKREQMSPIGRVIDTIIGGGDVHEFHYRVAQTVLSERESH